MHPQLAVIEQKFRRAEQRLRRLDEAVPPDRWVARPAPERWSVGECVAHLNLTAEAFQPGIEAALEEGTARAPHARRRYRRDLFGWLLCKIRQHIEVSTDGGTTWRTTFDAVYRRP